MLGARPEDANLRRDMRHLCATVGPEFERGPPLTYKLYSGPLMRARERRRSRVKTAGADTILTPTPSDDALPRRFADFPTLGEALDYAAGGTRGLNFHDPRGNLIRAYPFAELREDAHGVARRLIARGKGSHATAAMSGIRSRLGFFAARICQNCTSLERPCEG